MGGLHSSLFFEAACSIDTGLRSYPSHADSHCPFPLKLTFPAATGKLLAAGSVQDWVSQKGSTALSQPASCRVGKSVCLLPQLVTLPRHDASINMEAFPLGICLAVCYRSCKPEQV